MRCKPLDCGFVFCLWDKKLYWNWHELSFKISTREYKHWRKEVQASQNIKKQQL